MKKINVFVKVILLSFLFFACQASPEKLANEYCKIVANHKNEPDVLKEKLEEFSNKHENLRVASTARNDFYNDFMKHASNCVSEMKSALGLVEEVINNNESTSTETAKEEKNEEKNEQAAKSNADKEFDDFLVTYEELYNKYIDLMVKAKNGDVTYFKDAQEIMEKLKDYEEKLKVLQANVSVEKYAKFTEVSLKIMQKVAQQIK
ncbi:MAG: hypothetical protein EAZ85_05310 [Bacteroidetes bacterium]|nr:MAG: hypothetical protein EAZ85_05310 [Bacteroidota bacterium]TAG90066.1 MAG: hypothetical protein EAZ20_05115 [Bacteroidota bacterium]